jgi:NAD-dependent dihydropyrimidine dehydrogenase PreA subunit
LPRDIPVGNGNLLVTHDQSYVLRDIYYPFVGRENHTDGLGFRFGVWVDGKLDPLTYLKEGKVEYQGQRATITIDHKRCVGATMCAFTCPVAIYELVKDKSYLVAENLDKCLLQTCMNCRNHCPTNAIKIALH